MLASNLASKRMREGAHNGERETADAVVGSVAHAALQRFRAQKGVAATARRGQAATLAHVAKVGRVAPVVMKEVARAMRKGTAETAERSWDKFIHEGGQHYYCT